MPMNVNEKLTEYLTIRERLLYIACNSTAMRTEQRIHAIKFFRISDRMKDCFLILHASNLPMQRAPCNFYIP